MRVVAIGGIQQDDLSRWYSRTGLLLEKLRNLGTMVWEHFWSQLEPAGAMISVCVSTLGPLFKGRNAGSTRRHSISSKDAPFRNPEISIRHPTEHPASLTLASPNDLSPATPKNVVHVRYR